MSTIRVGIVGYGNLGKGAAAAVAQAPDMELTAIFTRREPTGIEAPAPVIRLSEAAAYQDKIDVMLLCGGSATDLPEQGPALAALFSTVDSFDTHAHIPDYFAAVDAAAKAHGQASIISTGWDPGLFSLQRLLAETVLPQGKEYTFWGKGVSQGHSDAIRRIEGVADAKQYTIPLESALTAVRNGENPDLTARQKHRRDCYVVTKQGADQAKIAETICRMPNYFADYDTNVYFISAEQFAAEHSAMPHGGFVCRSGQTGHGTQQFMEFSLQLGSNPEFTGSVLAAYARAVYRLKQHGARGAFTVFDAPFAWLSPESSDVLRARLL